METNDIDAGRAPAPAPTCEVCHLSEEMHRAHRLECRRKRPALLACQECGHKFRTVRAAERAYFGDGCPKCGGADIGEV